MNIADRLLNEAHVATTPGLDFDTEQGMSSIRLSFAGTNEDMHEAVRRINTWVRDNLG
jgi:aspartate/methionine/tyrosine aminotransferase